MDVIKDKLILITGGTGSIGEQLVQTLLEKYSPKRIRIYSRDETKQFNLLKKFEAYKDKIRLFIGDIRDKDRLIRAMKNVDVVFNLAAMNHVTACEYNPFEAIKTNIIGIQNLIEVSIENNIERFIFTSTDKAATPSNTMGVTKLMGEKLVTTANYYKGNVRTIFYSVRFGNILGSRGSIIPIIEQQIINNRPITITDSEMTRYIMGAKTAINFIFNTLEIAQGGEVFVLKMHAIKIIDLIEVLIEYFAKKHNKNIEKIIINEVGMFVGEKLYEELFSIEESERTYEINGMYLIFPQLTEVFSKIDMDKFPNSKKFDITKPFNSKFGPFLSKKDIKELLIKLNVI